MAVCVGIGVRLGSREAPGKGVELGMAVRVSATMVPTRSLFGFVEVAGMDGEKRPQADTIISTSRAKKAIILKRFTGDLLSGRIEFPWV